MAVAEEDGHWPSRRLQQLVRGQLLNLGRRGSGGVADVDRVRVAIEVDSVGVDDDQLRAAFGHRLLDAQVHDRHVLLRVRGHDNDHARVIYLFDQKLVWVWLRQRRPAMHLDLCALEGPVQEPAEEEGLLVCQVLRQ